MRLIYEIGIRAYYLLILLASVWNRKAAKWISGRRSWRNSLGKLFEPGDRIFWFHCASLGEFEQGRPVIEAVRDDLPNIKILLTFFSPSGYEKQKDFPAADHVMYLPLDTRKNAHYLIRTLPLSAAFFIKYEFWPNMLFELGKARVPTYLISGHFRSNQFFFKWYGSWLRKAFNSFSHIFVQSPESSILLSEKGIENVSVAGDTRFDRVMSIADRAENISAFEFFDKKRTVLIAGSTWEEDENIVIKVFRELKDKIKLIIAPHEPGEKAVNRIREKLPQGVRIGLFSEVNGKSHVDTDVVIVDTVGHLSRIYRYGDLAFIGGGFGRGIHNILEASAAGLPVIFGPKHADFREANELVDAGGAFSIANEYEALEIIRSFLDNQEKLQNASFISKDYTSKNAGATARILSRIRDDLATGFTK